MIFVDVKGEVIPSGNEWLYSWYGIQAVSPKTVQNALSRANGQPITVRINSGGGDVFAGCDIYNMLMTYKGDVIIEIHGLCASIASVIAMAGKCKMSPLAEIMIHNVSTKASGDYRDMEHTAEILKKANKPISNAYIMKAGLDEKEIKKMMDKETWLTAEEALELGLIDEIMFTDEKVDKSMVDLLKNSAVSMCNSVSKIDNNLLERFRNFNPIMNQPKESTVDFFMQQKLQAKLKLLNLKGEK